MAAGRRTATLSPLLAFVLCVGCSGAARLSPRSSPYDQYVAMLQRSGLDKTNLGGAWTAASASALRSAAPITSPFAETGYFAAGQPTAVAYRLELQRGRRLVIEVGFEAIEPGRLFVDLFRTESNGALRRVASMEGDEPLIQVRRGSDRHLRASPPTRAPAEWPIYACGENGRRSPHVPCQWSDLARHTERLWRRTRPRRPCPRRHRHLCPARHACGRGNGRCRPA